MTTAAKRFLLSQEKSCIYCGGANETIEHMPPTIMFLAKSRPSGFEFASCRACNNGTGTADKVASLLARIDPFDSYSEQDRRDIEKLQRGLVNNAYGAMLEIANANTEDPARTSQGLILPGVYQLSLDGPIIGACLDVFSAKFSMSLYRELTGSRLPPHGYVTSAWVLNSGLPDKFLDDLVERLSLKRVDVKGWTRHDDQFSCFAASNGINLTAGIASFHKGRLTIIGIGNGAPSSELTIGLSTSKLVRPGELLSLMPRDYGRARYQFSKHGILHRPPGKTSI